MASYLARKTTQMKKVILTYGLIAGIFVSAMMLMSLAFKDSFDMTTGMIYGYATMIMAFSMIFVAVRQYRNKFLGGSISFGKAFLIGLGITLIAAIFYVITWEIEFRFFIPEFIDEFVKVIPDPKEAAAYATKYKNPVFRIPTTFMEIFPVGLVISLICAAVLRKK